MVKKLFEIESTTNLRLTNLKEKLQQILGMNKLIGIKEIKEKEVKNILIEINDEHEENPKLIRLQIKNNNLKQILADEEKITHIKTIEVNNNEIRIVLKEK